MDKAIFCLIVDPLISPRQLSAALQLRNIKLIALLTDLSISAEEHKKRFLQEYFTATYRYTDLDSTLKLLKQYPIARVLAGYDESVKIADMLVAKICPQFANSPATTNNRQHKFMMHETLRKAGLKCVKQIKITHAVLSAAEKHQIEKIGFPVIIKPTIGCASIGVKRCHTLDEITAYLQQNIHHDLVIQECLQGEEYFVDTVSLAGKHALASVFKYHKTMQHGVPVYRYEDIVNPQAETALQLSNYVKKVLDAVGLDFGPAHTEVFMTADGPCLIEVNPRISGAHGIANEIANATSGTDQWQLIATSIAAPNDFIKSLLTQPQLTSQGRAIILNSWEQKIFNSLQLQKIKNLPSYHGHKQLKKVGEPISPPTTLYDAVALITLIHPDKHQIEHDSEYIFDLEQRGELF